MAAVNDKRIKTPSMGGVTFLTGTITYRCKHESEGNHSCNLFPKEKKIMLREMDPVAASRARSRSPKHETAMLTTCVLCRVLWPIVVQHRHLVFDCALEPTRSSFRDAKLEQTAIESVTLLAETSLTDDRAK